MNNGSHDMPLKDLLAWSCPVLSVLTGGSMSSLTVKPSA